MKYSGTLIAVKDAEVSKKFYGDLFDQKILMDLGTHVSFGDFAIQQEYSSLVGFDPETMIQKSHNMELYFEVDDFDSFIKKLDEYGSIKYVHPTKKYDWQQRVIRIYDPDDHIIEIGESMAYLARKFLSEGYSIEETAKQIMHAVEFVQAVSDGKIF